MDRLPTLHRIGLPGAGPEDVVADAQGCLYTGLADGRILRIDPAVSGPAAVTVLARMPGRPLGLEYTADGQLLVCNSPRGLWSLDLSRRTFTRLLRDVAGQRQIFCSNVVQAADGTQYFTVSSQRHTVHHYRRDLLENHGTGALFRRDPDGQVQCLWDGINFANGLVLTPDEGALIVAETTEQRLWRYTLQGAQAGRTEVFCTLEGYPDNLSLSADGTLWVAIAAPHNPLLERLQGLPWPARRLLARLPQALLPKPEPLAWVEGFDVQGRRLHRYQWRGGDYAMVTGLCQVGRRVYLGGLTEAALAWFELPEPDAAGL